MADNTFFGRLRRLFSTQTVVQNVGGKKLRVVDTDRSQAYKGATNFLTDRYTRLHSGGQNQHGYNQTQQFMAQRLSLFADYEEMDNDPIIASALDVYADESTMKNEEFIKMLKNLIKETMGETKEVLLETPKKVKTIREKMRERAKNRQA